MTLRIELTTAQLTELQECIGYGADIDLPVARLLIIELAHYGVSVRHISATVNLHHINVRKWIHRYERSGIDGLCSGKSTGRPVMFDGATRAEIARIYQTKPRRLGLSFREWSLNRLRAYLMERGIVERVSCETVRSIAKGIKYA